MAILSIAMTMGLVAMDTAHASSVVPSKGGDATAQRIARGAVDPDWGPRLQTRVR
jgi:hypothetical protein